MRNKCIFAIRHFFNSEKRKCWTDSEKMCHGNDDPEDRKLSGRFAVVDDYQILTVFLKLARSHDTGYCRDIPHIPYESEALENTWIHAFLQYVGLFPFSILSSKAYSEHC